MEYFLLLILLLLGIIIYGFIMRKKVYKEVDKLEKWKIDIMNRPVTDEIAKVKQLNMTGQTEAKFEDWRVNWDEVVTNQLPAVDELLFDVEEKADRYQFKKASGIIRKIQGILQEVEDKIDRILADLQELIGSEEKNKIEIEELKGLMKKNRKIMLANRHAFGSSILQLEKDLEEIINKFNEFDILTNGGNYLAARELVFLIRNDLEMLACKLEELPKLLSICQSDIPLQIQEIRKGQAEMVQSGYVIDHLEINKELDKIESEIGSYLIKLEKTEIDIVNHGIADVKDRIEHIYDCLEKEVIAKHIVMKEMPCIDPLLKELNDKVNEIKQETEIVQQSYHLKEKDLEDQHKIDKKVTQIIVKYESLLKKMNENHEPATKLRDELEEVKQNINKVKEQYVHFTDMLHTLRKDEREAKDRIMQMKKMIVDAKGMIRGNHLPGLPERVIKWFDTAEANLRAVTYKLEENPLDMEAVNHLLDEAQDAVDRVYNKTEELVEKAILVEQLIQYGNRYRSRYPILSAKLSEAEQVFRMYDYDLALEQAATAIEEIEPGALKKLSEMEK